jgi:hypothetical protein
MVYVAVATALDTAAVAAAVAVFTEAVVVGAAAIACRVSEAPTLMGLEYLLELVVGVEPLVV